MMAAQRGRCFSRAAEGLVFLPVPGLSAVRWHPHPEMRTVPPMVSPPPRGQDGAALRMAARAKRDPAKAATPTSNGCLGRGEGGGDGAACRFVEAGADRVGRIVFHSIPPHSHSSPASTPQHGSQPPGSFPWQDGCKDTTLAAFRQDSFLPFCNGAQQRQLACPEMQHSRF